MNLFIKDLSIEIREQKSHLRYLFEKVYYMFPGEWDMQVPPEPPPAIMLSEPLPDLFSDPREAWIPTTPVSSGTDGDGIWLSHALLSTPSGDNTQQEGLGSFKPKRRSRLMSCRRSSLARNNYLRDYMKLAIRLFPDILPTTGLKVLYNTETFGLLIQLLVKRNINVVELFSELRETYESKQNRNDSRTLKARARYYAKMMKTVENLAKIEGQATSRALALCRFNTTNKQ